MRADGLQLERTLGHVAVGGVKLLFNCRENLTAVKQLFLRARFLGRSAHIPSELLLLEDGFLSLIGDPQ